MLFSHNRPKYGSSACCLRSPAGVSTLLFILFQTAFAHSAFVSGSVCFRSPVLHLHVGNHWDAEGRYCGSQQVGGGPAASKHTQTCSCWLQTGRPDAGSHLLLFVILGTTAWRPWFITAFG